MEDGLNVVKIMCVSIVLSFFLLFPLVHSIVYCCTKKKTKTSTTLELSLGNIERHMSEAEIEHEFEGDHRCLRFFSIYSIYSRLGIVATIGLYFLVHNGTYTFLNSKDSPIILIVDSFCYVSWMIWPFIVLIEACFSTNIYDFDLLWAKNNRISITQYLNDLIRTTPKITMSFEVYHMVGGGDTVPVEREIDYSLERPFIFPGGKIRLPIHRLYLYRKKINIFA